MNELPVVVVGKRWWRRDWSLDLGIAIATLVGAAVTALITAWQKSSWPQAFATIIVALTICVFSGVKAFRLKRREDRYTPVVEPPEIVGWAHGLYAHLQRATKFDVQSPDHLRIVVHRVEYEKDGRTPKHLEQIINYVGGRGGPAGRITSARSGIIGKCARTGCPWWLSRLQPEVDKFTEKLVEDWGYFWEEASLISASRQSFAAFPITMRANGPTIGVVFLDSSDKGFFAVPVMDIIFNSTIALTETIRLL